MDKQLLKDLLHFIEKHTHWTDQVIYEDNFGKNPVEEVKEYLEDAE